MKWTFTYTIEGEGEDDVTNPQYPLTHFIFF